MVVVNGEVFGRVGTDLRTMYSLRYEKAIE